MIAPEKDFRVALRAKEAPVQGAFFLVQNSIKVLLIGNNAVHDNKDSGFMIFRIIPYSGEFKTKRI